MGWYFFSFSKTCLNKQLGQHSATNALFFLSNSISAYKSKPYSLKKKKSEKERKKKRPEKQKVQNKDYIKFQLPETTTDNILWSNPPDFILHITSICHHST